MDNQELANTVALTESAMGANQSWRIGLLLTCLLSTRVSGQEGRPTDLSIVTYDGAHVGQKTVAKVIEAAAPAQSLSTQEANTTVNVYVLSDVSNSNPNVPWAKLVASQVLAGPGCTSNGH